MDIRNSRAYLFFKLIRARVHYYCLCSTIHGLKFIAQPTTTIFEWWLWMLICTSSFFGLCLIFSASIVTFSNNAVTLSADTNYLDWNTTFPAVTICEVYNSEKQWDINEEVYGSDRNSLLDEYFADISFFTGSCYSCETTCQDIECPKNFTAVGDLYRASCEAMLDDCTYNGWAFDCCDLFLPVETEFGICFSINSLHSKFAFVQNEYNIPGIYETAEGKFSLLNNHDTGPGTLQLQIGEDVKIYIHPPEDVVQQNSEPEIKDLLLWGSKAFMLFKVTEVVNDVELTKLPIYQRNCRFPYELPPDWIAYKHYSYTSCIVQCKIEEHLRLCNCTHHLMPSSYAHRYCDLEGLVCLSGFEATFRQIKTEHINKPGLVCDCLPSCVEPEYNLVHSHSSLDDEGNGSFVTVRMQSLPSERYVRKMARTYLDLVVSLGSNMGLFFGASLLSLVELLYFLCCRKWRVNGIIDK